jgi:hypothetical protein
MPRFLQGNPDYDNLDFLMLVFPYSILSQLIQELTCGNNRDIPY